jgi:hypothetical protein
MPLSQDLIVFKSPNHDTAHGRVFRVTGDYPGWAVVSVAENTGTFSQSSVVTLANDLLYLCSEGLATLSTVTAYGGMKTSWPDAKVNVRMREELTRDSRLALMPGSSQLWVVPQGLGGAGHVWVMHYAHSGAWTRFSFPEPAAAAGEDFVIIGDGLYKLHEWYSQDEVNNVKRAIEASLGLGVLFRKNQILLKGAMALFVAPPSTYAELVVNDRFRVPLTAAPDTLYDIAFSDDDIACLDDDPLVPGTGRLSTARKRCLVRGWSLDVRLVMRGGGFSLSSAGIETVEV